MQNNRSKIGIIDNPVSIDHLGVKNKIEGLCKFILQANTPITIAIQGDWGVGKSSVLEYVKEHINKSNQVIEFNAWEFSLFDNKRPLAISLIEKIYFKLTGSSSKTKKLINQIVKVGIDYAYAISPFKLPNITKIIDSMTQNESDIYDNLKKKMREAIQSVIKNKGKDRIVILVDDLDRIKPERAVEIMEVMQNFLLHDNCVFILAIDYNIIKNGIIKKYNSIENERVEKFFEKIIQIPFTINTNSYKIDEFINDEIKPQYINKDKLNNYIDICETILNNNPRTIKRIFNLMELYRTIINDDEKFFETACFRFLILAIQNNMNALYSEIFKGSYTDFDVNELIKKVHNSVNCNEVSKEIICNEIEENKKYMIDVIEDISITNVEDYDELDAKVKYCKEIYDTFDTKFGEKFINDLNDKEELFYKGGRRDKGIFTIVYKDKFNNIFKYGVEVGFDFKVNNFFNDLNKNKDVVMSVSFYSYARSGGYKNTNHEDLDFDRKSDIEKMHKLLRNFKIRGKEFDLCKNSKGLKTHIIIDDIYKFNTKLINEKEVLDLINNGIEDIKKRFK